MSYTPNALKLFCRMKARAFALIIVTLLVAGLSPAHAVDQDLRKFNQFVQTSDTPAMRMLREGRDLIDSEQWEKAAEKFSQFVNAYSKDKDVDVALYWLAYSLRKQGDPRAAVSRLEILLKKYPQSAWADEARAMLNELAGDLKESRVPQNTLDNAKEDEEIKIIALRSLFEANPERAMVYIAEILKSGSTASPNMKHTAVSLLGSRGGPQALAILLDIARSHTDTELRARAIHSLGEEGGPAVFDDLVRLYDAERSLEVKRQILHAFFEMDEHPRSHAKLVEIARNQSENSELRRTAIHWLGERRNPAAFDDLMQIYNTERDAEIKRQILHAFSEMEDQRALAKLLEIARNQNETSELRRTAIHWIGERDNEAALDELMRIYASDRDTEVRRQILHAFSEMKSPRARAKLVEAARSGDNLELRKTAIHWLGESKDAQTLDMLISMYDAETNTEVKQQLLHAFSESKQKRALQKLMDVARRDPSIELRKQAIHWLGESDDPDALRFLEELLKP